MNTRSSALTTVALTAAGLVLSAGAAHAAAPRISSHEQLQASITAAAAAITTNQALGNPAGMPAKAAVAATLPGPHPVGLRAV